jgi:hypothetical protein
LQQKSGVASVMLINHAIFKQLSIKHGAIAGLHAALKYKNKL